MVMSSRSALFLSQGWLSKSAPASVVMSIRNEFSLPLLSASSSLSEGPCIFSNKQTGLYSREGIVVCVCVCVCVFIKLHITAQSGVVIVVILCYSR